MRILDLYCGLKGWSSAFVERGHEAVTIDFNKKFNPTICADMMTVTAQQLLEKYGKFDAVLASPPCETYSVASIGHHWNPDKTPKTDAARAAILLLEHTVKLIEELGAPYWILENPRGMMRNMEVLKRFKRSTVTYCQYGEKRMKPTDLWGVMPQGFEFRPPCAKRAPCHVAAPRGSTTGTQGMGSYAIKSLIPTPLALEVCVTLEKAILGEYVPPVPQAPPELPEPAPIEPFKAIGQPSLFS
jgi:hypothetical protein